ncbi:Autophagy-related protein 38 [Kluyveromyces marxianus]
MTSELKNCIEDAESFIKSNKVVVAIQEYRKAIKQLDYINETEDLPENVQYAVTLLHDDILLRVKELGVLQEVQSNSESSESGSNSSISRFVSDGSLYPNGNSVLISDPLLLSITSKLENSVMRLINASEDPGSVSKTEIMQQFSQFKRELTVYEQKKSKDYEGKMEQVIKENKKLSNQVNRLKERWDSLVESAKQKRNQQHV